MSNLIQGAQNDSNGDCLGLSLASYNYILTHFDLASDFYKGIKFVTKDGVCQEFFVDTDGLLKEIKNSGLPQNILSDKFDVNYVRFIINGDKTIEGSASSDSIQPRVTFVLNVATQGSQDLQNKVIQTTEQLH